ncbi:hypothetical protein LMG31506_03040 [Cupriavidus yeoncheonensis]|uniref:Uncharacterized protein n=1 Tax=Cupriavidus yeoncheonensis TaxID=1462994 RepID=A0A916IVM2_9BURK|nr:hypothetical protein [Cupriavidus yeoncheonensis]CAG2144589.1 hypothetical protein LMG31506_03040 [Cupriavidus yeoncheonensis]
MADDIDLAQERDARNLAEALAVQRTRAKATQHLTATGECLNPHCCEPFAANDEGRLFCGPGCEQDYRRLKRAA